MNTSIARFAVLGLALASAAGAAGEESTRRDELARRDVLDGRVSLLLPRSFDLISDGSHRAFVFADATGAVNVAARHSGLSITPEELVEAQRDIEQSVSTQAPTAVWLQSEILSKDGQPYLLLVYQSPGVDVDVQNFMYVTSVDGRLLTVSFNCPLKGAEQWLDYGQEIIESVVVAKPASIGATR